MLRRRDGRGSATVELAAAIPLLVVVTLAMIGVIVVARDAVLAQGAAREGAREAALGGDQARAAAAARAAVLAALGALPPGGGPGASHGRPSVPMGPVGGGEPAARAGAVAAANGAELVACACGPTEAVVTVRSRVRLLPGEMVLSMTARAR